MTTIQYCPSCGSSALRHHEKHVKCDQCDFVYYHNTASAVMAIIRCNDEVLIAIRGREPGLGMWDFPGGFVDYDESLEQALYRELNEELGFTPPHCRYVGSSPNTYLYKNITYKTCDCIFIIDLMNKPILVAADDVAEILWVPVTDISPDRFAFDSTRQALNFLQK